MSYSTNGKIPEKFIIRLNDKSVCFEQNYFNGDVLANKDFETNNELIKDKQRAEIFSYKDSKSVCKGDIIVENLPMKLRLIGVSNQSYGRFSGNYPFLILLQNKYIVKIASDILLESLLLDGIDKNGELNSEFIVANTHQTTTFIRKNSGAHQACNNHMKNLEKSTLKDLSFEFGRIYEKANGTIGLFLGYVTTTAVKPSFIYDLKKHSISVKDLYFLKNIKIKSRKVKLATLWYEINKYHINHLQRTGIGLEGGMAKMYNASLLSAYPNFNCYLGNAHKFINVSKYDKLDLGSPKDVIYRIANKYVGDVNETMMLIQKRYNTCKQSPYYPDKINLQLLHKCYKDSTIVNMEIYGGPAKVNHCYEDLEKNWFSKFIDEYNRDPKPYKFL